jgi:hypothetical protein
MNMRTFPAKAIRKAAYKILGLAEEKRREKREIPVAASGGGAKCCIALMYMYW